MASVNSLDNKKSKKSPGAFLLWWRTDPVEVQRQIAGYDSLRVWQSARGTSALLCLLTVVVTMLLGGFMHLSSGEIATEAVVWTIVAILMYRGYRWAFLAGMLLWTFEKGGLLFSSGAAPVVQIIWWTIYMSAFFLAFKVETDRARARQAPCAA
jgi:hypothetical protein